MCRKGRNREPITYAMPGLIFLQEGRLGTRPSPSALARQGMAHVVCRAQPSSCLGQWDVSRHGLGVAEGTYPSLQLAPLSSPQSGK